jgi:glutamine---fructose-6-phosphate transaminase (isomerizing)
MTETLSHMAREVAEIPEAARRFLTLSAGATARAAEAVRKADPALVVTVARGSSDHAATYLKYAVELQAGIPVASVGPSVASIYRRPLRLGRAVCVGISQSGQSPDIVEMMRAAAAGGALTVAVTNHAESPLAKASAHCLALQSGPEQSVAATKTFVASVLAGLALLAACAGPSPDCRRSSRRPWRWTGRRWLIACLGRSRCMSLVAGRPLPSPTRQR